MAKNEKLNEEKEVVKKNSPEGEYKDDSPVGIARESFYSGA